MKQSKKFKLHGDLLTFLLVAVAFGVIAYLLYGGHLTRQVSNMLIPISVYIVLAVSLNLVVGLLGELSLGHAGFMSVGLFSGCLISIALAEVLPMPVRLPLSMLCGGLIAALFGLVVGLPALRLKGDYLAIVTLACGEIIKNIITNLDLTGGALGLNTNAIYSNAKTLLPYAESVGIDVTWYKLVVFMLAAFFAGAAGTLYGHYFANVKAASFDYNMSIEILVIVVLGGMGSIPGSIIAAVVLTALPEAMREFADYRMLLYAIVLILVMLTTNNPGMKEFFSRLRPSVLFRRLTAKKSPQKEGA